MDLDESTGNERLVAEQAVLAFREMNRAGAAAPNGHGMSALERVAVGPGFETIRKMVELSASEHSGAQKKGSAANRVRAETR